ALTDKDTEDLREDRVSVVVVAIDLPARLFQILFQVPQLGGLLDLFGFLLDLSHDRSQFPLQCPIHGLPRDSLFPGRPLQFAHRHMFRSSENRILSRSGERQTLIPGSGSLSSTMTHCPDVRVLPTPWLLLVSSLCFE